MTAYVDQYIEEAIKILNKIDRLTIDHMVDLLVNLRKRNGRLFIIGVGGGAGHASHAVSDFRKITRIETYTPTDNVAELTAQINDVGWETVFINWLMESKLDSKDMILVFSVGGGNADRNISVNIIKALQYAQKVGATISGIVGRDGGFTAQVADVCIVIPVVNPSTVTAHTESFQALVWHLLVSHPKLKVVEMKWESAIRP